MIYCSVTYTLPLTQTLWVRKWAFSTKL